MRRAVFLLCPPVLLLAACDRGESEKVDTRPQPVLEGTVSDAMLRTDELRAPAPLAEPVASGSPGEEQADADAETGEGSARPARKSRLREKAGEGADKTASRAKAADRADDDASPSPRPRPTPRATRSPSPRPTATP